jgi:hypothetical protein
MKLKRKIIGLLGDEKGGGKPPYKYRFLGKEG